MAGCRAILIFVMGLGLAVCPLTRAEQSVTLAWNPCPCPSVAGYIISQGSDGTNYGSQMDTGTNTSWCITGLQDGSTNYFVVAAYDANHNESPPSSPIKYVAPGAARPLLAAAPAVTTQPATGVGSADATLNATVNPDLSATTVYFEYGLTTAYGNYSGSATLSSDLVDAQTVALAITGLPPGAVIHFQAVAQNSSGTSFGGDLTFVTPAAGPVLAAAPDQFINVGSTLFVTNSVAEANGAAGPFTFSLGTGAPSGASITPNGVFEWIPACEQGSSTNLITVWASGSGTPALSNSVSFAVVVGSCVRVTIGSSVTLIGNAGSVPVSLYSTVSVTNVNFSIATLYGRFANWEAAAGNLDKVSATTQASDPANPRFNFAVQSGRALLGASSLGTISFQVLPAGESAFAPLVVNQIATMAADSTLAAADFGQSGRVVLIAGQPLLELSLTNSLTPVLTLYGNPGSNYVVQCANSLLASGTWTPYTNLTLAGPAQIINPGSLTNQVGFFRAAQE